ncbi:MAG: hypothetical protein ACTSQJ_08685 [Promethearchaeota archaeon]
MFKKRILEIVNKFQEKKVVEICKSANFFGQKSIGWKQIRGNGVLILTEEELYFEMWHPKRILQIPIKFVQKIETPKSFLGKSKFKRLLKVVFKSKNNIIDSAAWLVNKLDRWKISLGNLIIN